MKVLLAVCVTVLVASGASAQMLADFEGGVNPFSAGTIVADPEDAGNNVLYLAAGQTGVLTLATPVARGSAVSVKIYDQALSAADDLTDPANPIPLADSRDPNNSQYGWQVGVSGTDPNNWAVTLQNRSFIGANSSYAWTGNFYVDWPQSFGGLYSMYHYGDPRQVGPGGLAIIGSGTIDNPDIPGDGAWSTWTFSLLDTGDVYCHTPGIAFSDSQVSAGTDDLPGGGGPVPAPEETQFDQVFVCGGRSHATVGLLGGVWIDDVQVVAAIEPPPTLQADFDGDGDVDLDDFVILKNNWGSSSPAGGDADGDGDVDLDDFVILKNEWGS